MKPDAPTQPTSRPHLQECAEGFDIPGRFEIPSLPSAESIRDLRGEFESGLHLGNGGSPLRASIFGRCLPSWQRPAMNRKQRRGYSSSGKAWLRLRRNGNDVRGLSASKAYTIVVARRQSPGASGPLIRVR